MCPSTNLIKFLSQVIKLWDKMKKWPLSPFSDTFTLYFHCNCGFTVYSVVNLILLFNRIVYLNNLWLRCDSSSHKITTLTKTTYYIGFGSVFFNVYYEVIDYIYKIYITHIVIKNQCRCMRLRNKHKSTELQYVQDKIINWDHDIADSLFWITWNRCSNWKEGHMLQLKSVHCALIVFPGRGPIGQPGIETLTNLTPKRRC